jgi:hypothetical protein
MMAITHQWQGEVMEPAFSGFVDYCMKHRMGEYLEETGDTFTPGRGLDAMIDEATGRNEDFVQRFASFSLHNC